MSPLLKIPLQSLEFGTIAQSHFAKKKNLRKFTKRDKANIELQMQRYRLPTKIILVTHVEIRLYIEAYNQSDTRKCYEESGQSGRESSKQQFQSLCEVVGFLESERKKKRRFFIYSYGVYVISSNLHTCKRNLYPLRMFQSKGNGRSFDEKSGFSRDTVDRPQNVRKHREYVYTYFAAGWLSMRRETWLAAWYLGKANRPMSQPVWKALESIRHTGDRAAISRFSADLSDQRRQRLTITRHADPTCRSRDQGPL